jgi:prepilin-type N-terminal cleavage/methylation domain-containing protein
MIPARVFRGATGFTLMETLVVVAIIGLATVVAIPYLARTSRRQRLVGAAHEIQQSLLAARMRAVRANQNTSLLITAAAPGEVVHELDTIAPDNPPAPPPPPVGKAYISASALAFVTLPVNNKVTFGGDGRVIAPPAPTPGVITVQGPVGSPVLNQVTIRVNSTGRIEVVTPAVWQ